MDLVRLMVYRVAEGFLYCLIRPVKSADSKFTVRNFSDIFFKDVVSDISQCISQLPVQRPFKGRFGHADAGRVRLVHDFDLCEGKVIFGMFIEEHQSYINRLPVF